MQCEAKSFGNGRTTPIPATSMKCSLSTKHEESVNNIQVQIASAVPSVNLLESIDCPRQVGKKSIIIITAVTELVPEEADLDSPTRTWQQDTLRSADLNTKLVQTFIRHKLPDNAGHSQKLLPNTIRGQEKRRTNSKSESKISIINYSCS